MPTTSVGACCLANRAHWFITASGQTTSVVRMVSSGASKWDGAQGMRSQSGRTSLATDGFVSCTTMGWAALPTSALGTTALVSPAAAAAAASSAAAAAASAAFRFCRRASSDSASDSCRRLFGSAAFEDPGITLVVTRASSCTVLPRPMSSPRMPPRTGAAGGGALMPMVPCTRDRKIMVCGTSMMCTWSNSRSSSTDRGHRSRRIIQPNACAW
mmetsp:Transcript_16726/g.52273  ORF Transcript_16726/g.52273 Transcript_16726/m.52273 type:complete len:214 (+) Transcript_16726:639-1280(+)